MPMGAPAEKERRSCRWEGRRPKAALAAEGAGSLLAEPIIDALMRALTHMIFGLGRGGEGAVGEHRMKPRIEIDLALPSPCVGPRVQADHREVCLLPIGFPDLIRFVCGTHLCNVLVSALQRKGNASAKSARKSLALGGNALPRSSGRRGLRRDGRSSACPLSRPIHHKSCPSLNQPGPPDRKLNQEVRDAETSLSQLLHFRFSRP